MLPTPNTGQAVSVGIGKKYATIARTSGGVMDETPIEYRQQPAYS
jgi:hypothetical protein